SQRDRDYERSVRAGVIGGKLSRKRAGSRGVRLTEGHPDSCGGESGEGQQGQGGGGGEAHGSAAAGAHGRAFHLRRGIAMGRRAGSVSQEPVLRGAERGVVAGG